MKKVTILLALLLALYTQAQINVDFNSVTVSGTPAIGALPAGWMQYNVDGYTPNTNLSYMGTNAWITRQITAGNNAAQSISWYSAVQTSDDWMVSPAFNVPTPSGANHVLLTWSAYSPDANFRDHYKVYVSTTGNTVADFSTVLFEEDASAVGFETRGIDLSSYAGQSVYVAFRNTSNDKYILFIDDIKTNEIPQYDVAVTNLNIYKYALVNNVINVSGTLQNNGYATINSVTLDWNDGGTPHSQTLTGLNIGPLSSGSFTHSTPFIPTAVQAYTVNVTASAPNGGTDVNTANNSMTSPVFVLSAKPKKNPLFEENTGTWCGWCPRGAVALAYMKETYPGDFIGIAVHNGDPMTNTVYDGSVVADGYPSANVDRVVNMDANKDDWETQLNLRKNIVVPASVGCDVTVNTTTREVSADVVATFKGNMTGDWRLAAIVIEDSVHGTTSTYNQSNYYSFQSQNIALNGAGIDWQAATNPVPAATMYYENVGRELLGGFDGMAGTVPATVTDGGMYNHTFTYTVPAAYNLDKIEVIAVLIDNSDGSILNAFQFGKTSSGIYTMEPSKVQATLFPNPANEEVTLNISTKEAGDFRVAIYNIEGKQVMTQQVGKVTDNAQVTLNVSNLANGQYLVHITSGTQTTVKPLVVAK